MNTRLNVLFALFSSFALAQSKDGYWDNVRTTNETITLGAGKKKMIKTADFPLGTTEVVYRISILDDNQKISSSLVSVLKAIPDPTGISQGSAGAVFLASTISGDDKCKYVVFSNEKDALEYEKSSVLKNACVVQNEPINKEAKLLSEKSKCLNGNQNLWFVFESDNWIMNQKIVFEVVPWVDYKFKNGWTNAAKKELLLEIENNEFFKSINQKDKLLGYFIETFTSKYNFNEFKEIIPAEKAKAFSDVMDESLKKSGLMNGYLDGIRAEAKRFLSAKEYEKGMSLIENDIIQKGRATDLDYGLQGDFYLMTKQYIKAEVAIKKAISMNATNIVHQLRLAHVYMFSNRVSDAKDIHKKYRSNNVSSSKSWTQATKEDFENFKKNGLPTDDFKKILRILE
ncbi:tetratricopeptide repeat protein [Flavobacterium macrobrachii]|jgi:tetratricopeptide (TPR) repeat protein|uniref:tetratricopeptide repeat protein n=1 Tax=Flavobacterium macrobrachii TaxID=591204 RepID=UPI0037C01372